MESRDPRDREGDCKRKWKREREIEREREREKEREIESTNYLKFFRK